MNTGIPMDLLQLAGHRRALAEALMDGIDGDNLEALAAIEGEYQNAEAESAEEAIPYLTDLAKTEDALRAEIAGHKAFIAPYQARIARKQRALDTIREHAMDTMVLFEYTSVRTEAGTWSISQRPKTEITDEAAVLADPRFRREVISVNKVVLGQVLKALKVRADAAKKAGKKPAPAHTLPGAALGSTRVLTRN